jgi:hypothetical protein
MLMVPEMRHTLALITMAALTGAFLLPAQAGERWPDIPPKIGLRQFRPAGLIPYRCSDEPVYNFYHRALYGEPPAVYLGHAYRAYYRYTAYRVMPRTYYCSER